MQSLAHACIFVYSTPIGHNFFSFRTYETTMSYTFGKQAFQQLKQPSKTLMSTPTYFLRLNNFITADNLVYFEHLKYKDSSLSFHKVSKGCAWLKDSGPISRFMSSIQSSIFESTKLSFLDTLGISNFP